MYAHLSMISFGKVNNSGNKDGRAVVLFIFPTVNT